MNTEKRMTQFSSKIQICPISFRKLLAECSYTTSLVYLNIALRAYSKDNAHPDASKGVIQISAGQVQKDTGIGQTAVQEGIKDLRQKGYLVQLEVNMKLGSIYWVNPMILGETSQSNAPDISANIELKLAEMIRILIRREIAEISFSTS